MTIYNLYVCAMYMHECVCVCLRALTHSFICAVNKFCRNTHTEGTDEKYNFIFFFVYKTQHQLTQSEIWLHPFIYLFLFYKMNEQRQRKKVQELSISKGETEMNSLLFARSVRLNMKKINLWTAHCNYKLKKKQRNNNDDWIVCSTHI